MYLPHEILTKIQKVTMSKLNEHCEADANQFEECLKQGVQHLNLPDGMIDRIDLFIKENRYLFYRGYRDKLIDRFDKNIDEMLRYKPLPFKTDAELQAGIGFKDQKDRLFLETYLACGKNGRVTSDKLGVAKSTFHDWLMKNEELIKAEESKT